MNRIITRTNDIDGDSARNTGVLVMFTALTNLADGVTKVALPLMATMLTASPALVAGVSVTLTLPWLLVALHVGVLVDRADRRVLLWIADITRLLVIAGLLSLVLTQGVTLPWLYVGGLTLGIAEVVAQTSASALIPDAVAPSGRERANAWMTGAETVCNEFFGPLVGGILVAGSTAVALGVVFGGYIAGVLILLLLVGNFRVKSLRNAPPASVHEQIVEGLKCLWEEKLLRLMALSLSVLCACWGAWLALMPMFATTAMGLDAKGYGIMLSALGVGGLVGAVSTTTLNRLFGRRNVMLADLVGTFAMVATPVITTNLWAVSAGAFIGGLGGTLWTVNSRTISQRLVPNSMLGRYSAASRLFSWGAMPIGAALVGLLAEFFGIRVAFSVFAICTALLIIPFIRVVTPSRLDAVGA
ncbi:MFS transporter [Pseudomonas syringae group genomosp. 3]|nr:MFS transporter [Pseudomonas syringae group genomosp. 3]